MADSTEALNKKFNETLAKVIARYRTVRDQRVIVYKVSSRRVATGDSIYGDMPFETQRSTRSRMKRYCRIDTGRE